MKLGSLKVGGRDGSLVVVSRDLSRGVPVPAIAPTLQNALECWTEVAPALADMADRLERGLLAEARPLDPGLLAAPLPRAYQFADSSAYVVHVELVRRARNADMPPSLWTDPLMYQGCSDGFLGPTDPIPLASEDWGIDFEAEIAVITDDVPMGVKADKAGDCVRLLALVNDVSLRNLIPAELAKGFGFVHGKAATAFSPVAVTPDELGDAWDGRRLKLPIRVRVNGEDFGAPDCGTDMQFGFHQLIAHAAATRPLGAGTVLGSGTISNYGYKAGHACIAELRALETVKKGEPQTPFLRFGDRVRIEMLDGSGRSVFGAIDQAVAQVPAP